MSFNQLIEDFDMCYEWLISFFYDFFDFVNDNKLITAALICTIAVPSLIFIVEFFLRVSSSGFRHIEEKKKNKTFSSYKSLNKYQKAYLHSLRFDKK